MKISINGEIVDRNKACISVLDHALLYGDGVFEGIRIYNRMVFRLEDHLNRLAHSAKAIHLKLPMGLLEIRGQILRTAKEFNQDNAYIRLVVTRGEGLLGLDPSSCSESRVICIIDQIKLYPNQGSKEGIDLITSSFRRPSSDILDPRVKSLNYLNSVMAKMEAKRYGADEALLLNQMGMIAEASGANVFIVLDRVLTTPPTTDGALPGITRRSVIEIAQSLNLAVQEKTIGRYELLDVDEVFLTGSGARISKVRSLDGQRIGSSDNWPVTDQICDAFDSFTKTHSIPFD